MKLVGLGLRNYVKDKFNLFDGLIVIISLVDFALTVSASDDNDDEGGVMGALRALRLLRVVKLARHWKSLQKIFQIMASSLVDISNFAVLLLLCLFVFALLGMELFAFSVYLDSNGDPHFGEEEI